jgi:RNA polymerase sigma factor (sigma-70 family)
MRSLPSSRVDDRALIERSFGEPAAFAEVYDRHAREIFRFVARRLGEQAAEDVIAETFLAAFRRRDRYDPARADVRPWLYGIAIRLIGKHRRSELRMLRAVARAGIDPISDGDLGPAEDRVIAAGMRRELAAALAGLSTAARDVLLLVAWADLSYEEVAAALEIPVGTVRSRLSRARSHVRETLAAESSQICETGALR